MTVAVDSEFSSPAIVSVAASRIARISSPTRPTGKVLEDEPRNDVVHVVERRVAGRLPDELLRAAPNLLHVVVAGADSPAVPASSPRLRGIAAAASSLAAIAASCSCRSAA